MPTYEYICESCGSRFEVLQDMSDEPLTVCETCGAQLHRLIGAGGGIIVKGKTRGVDVTRCGRSTPCCGSDSPCDTPTCMR